MYLTKRNQYICAQDEPTDGVVCRGSQEPDVNEASLPTPHTPPLAAPPAHLVF